MASSWIARWTPPGLRLVASRWLGRSIRYRGPYQDLAQARSNTSGYDERSILDTVVSATNDVLSGDAVYEQDGRKFLSPPPPDYVLAGLLLAAGRSGGKLSVVDFGGSLGSYYLRWAKILNRIKELHWCVVEQPHFVDAGRRLYAADTRIHFEHELCAAIRYQPNLILASGVLQFLENPYATLQSLARLEAQVIVVDRTPFCEDGKDRYFSQHVPEQLNRSSYPLQALGRAKLEQILSHDYSCVLDYLTHDAPINVKSAVAKYRGSIWMRRG